MVISHNLMAMNAERQFNIVTDKKSKTTEKLSSGYKINRAADDAAGLAISEKMRHLIRSLNQGTKNASDGVSWVQIGDGALNEVSDMIHRMNELAIKSLNGTNSESDREALNAEFEQLKTEVDRVSHTVQFNTLNIFEEHEDTYAQLVGNREWEDGTLVNIEAGCNTLSFAYKSDPDSDSYITATIEVEAGDYTINELADEIDSSLDAAGLKQNGIDIELTTEGIFNLNYEKGAGISSVSGGLSFVFNKQYRGGSLGTLIGTTSFPSESSRLLISSENNTLTFTIDDLNGGVTEKTVIFSDGSYTRQELIDILNTELAGTTVTAVASGNGIKLASDEKIITGFKGNMFKLDTGAVKYTSVFYDNVQYGNVELIPASITGAAVLTTNVNDEEHSYYYITSTNNTLSFKPNSDSSETTITIPNGKYTAAQMASTLNSLFSANGLGDDLVATSFLAGDYEGIKITSKIEGNDSAIGINKASSAYDTLFVERTEYVFTKTAVETGKLNSSSSYRSAPYTFGKKRFATNEKLQIATGQNDTFDIEVRKVSDTTNTLYRYTITLDAGEYDMTGLVNEINKQINNDSNLTGRLEAYAYSSQQIGLRGKENGDLYSIGLTFSNPDGSKDINTANKGYVDIFCVAKTTTTSAYSGTKLNPEITLNTTIPDKYTFTSADNILRVYEDGYGDAYRREVVFDINTEYTRQEIIDKINESLDAESRYVSFSANSSYVSQGSATSSNSSKGATTWNTVNVNKAGETVEEQGNVGQYSKDTAAKVVVGEALNKTTVINSSNDILNITINGVNSGNISLTRGSYTKSELVSMLQTKLDAVFGSGYGGVDVSIDPDGKLIFEARKTGHLGRETSIAYQTSKSTFLKYAEATKTAPSITSTYPLNDSISLIDGKSNKFVFSVNGSQKTVTLEAKTYTKAELISALNSKLAAYDVKVSEQAGRLVYENENGGEGTALSISYSNNYRFFAAIYGGGYTGYAKLTVPSGYEMADTISIDPTSDEFNVTVGAVKYSVKLTQGTYNSYKDFTDMLTNVFRTENVPLTASYSGKQLVLTSTIPGYMESISLNSNPSSGGTSMKAIFKNASYDKVTASLSQDNKLVLSKQGTGSLEVYSSDKGSIFQKSVVSGVEDLYSYSATKDFSKIDGGNISVPLTLNEYNNELSFDYLRTTNISTITNGYPTYSTTSVSVTLDKKTYNTFEELRAELQSKLDSSSAGAGKLKVTVDASGVVISTATPGNSFAVENFSGSFYDRIINTATLKTTALQVAEVNGGQTVSDGYTVGRKDIRNSEVDIKTGVNDVLKLDFTDPSNNSITLEITLDDGQYGGNALVNMINQKLSAELTAKGLDSDLITAQVGGVSTGVYGSDDANALVFKLCNRHEYSKEGEYIIDGVSGSAAFSVFYKTEGEISVAYSIGTKKLEDTISIDSNSKKLSFTCGGTKHELEIAEGDYTPEELVTAINTELAAQNANAMAGMEEGKLRIYATKYGNFEISNITGGLADKVFYNVVNGDGKNKDIRIQLSDDVDNYLDIERKIMNTAKLGINTLTITKEKYAGKAVDRLSEALSNLSTIRSYFGAMQNRLEHSIENLKNVSENTQAAESEIRDADIADEMVRLSMLNILEQSGYTIMTQANQSNNIVLALLS